MNRVVHESALRAAAKLVFSLGVVSGCGEVIADGRGATDADSITSKPADAREEAAVDAAVGPDAAVAFDAAAADAGEDLSGCDQLVSDRIAADAAAATDAEFLACCSLLAQAADNQAVIDFEDRWNSEQRYACCSALDWQGSMACTPWGPPAPPRFDHYAGVA